MNYPKEKANIIFKDFNTFFNLSESTYQKFIKSLYLEFTYYCNIKTLDKLKHSNIDINKKSTVVKKIKAYIKIFVLFIKFWLASIFISIFYKKYQLLKNTQFIFFQNNKRLSYSKLYNNNDNIVLLVPNINLIYNFNELKNQFILFPFSVNFRILHKMVSYHLKYAQNTNAFLSLYINKKAIGKKNDIIFKAFIYHSWAVKTAKFIHKNNNKTTVVLEADVGGPFHFLVDELNKLKIKTVHVQHGSFTSDNDHYTPIAKYMVCCSEREKNILSKKVCNKNNLFVYGAPTQTLLDSNNKTAKKSEFDILIIASGGFAFFQQEFINYFSNILYLLSNYKCILRLRPANSILEKENWSKIIKQNNNIAISKNTSLSEDIINSNIIICFSIDALISCLRQKKKTIYFVNKYEINGYKFLKEIKTVKAVHNINEYINAIKYYNTITQQEFEKLYDQETITKNFGESNIEKVKTNFTNALNTISNK